MSPIIALKAALRTALIADSELTTALGGPQVYDDVPRGANPPYVVFSEAASRDNGTVSDAGHVTDLALAVWSRQGGSREALAIADRIAALIDDADLPLAGHRLVNGRVVATELRRQPDKDLTRATLRLRLVTEVI